MNYYERLKRTAYRKQMHDALEKLKQENPKRFAELLKRAQNENYNQQVLRQREEDALREREEKRRQEELLKFRKLHCPIVRTLPEVPAVRGTLAYRVWNVSSGLLKSTGMNYTWKEVNFADRVPKPDNRSGLYSVALTGLSLLTTAGDYFQTGRNAASGFIELLGHIVEHQDGVTRAEVARLVCLFVTTENDNIENAVRELSHNYPCTPVHVVTPEQLADVIMRETLKQRMRGRQ